MPPTHRLDDDQAHARAEEALNDVVGCAHTIRWDDDHCLQGHVDHDGAHLVVIACRDAEHEPLVLSEDAWDALRRGVDV